MALDPLTCPIAYWAKHTPDAPAVVMAKGTLSYRTWDRQLNHLCAQLAHLPRGSHLGVVGRHDGVMMALVFACARLGLVFCPLNPAFSEVQRHNWRQRLGLTVVLRLDRPELSAVPLQLGLEADAPVGGWPLELTQPASVILTSGSTGEPKYVLHQLGQHMASAQGALTRIPFGSADRWLVSLPLFHVGGYALLWRVALAGGSLAVLTDAMPVGDLHTPPWAMLQPTHLSLVPTQVWRLLAQGVNLSALGVRTVLLGGAVIPQALTAALVAQGVAPWVSYGLTEMSSVVCAQLADATGAVGSPLPDRELVLRAGEIWVRGAVLCAGYVTATGLRQVTILDGWYPTGDLGEFLPEGQLRLTGRKDNQFISGGENIQPEAIERVLSTHPAIEQVMVVGVPHPEWGHRPVAYVASSAPLTVADLRAWLRQALPGFMCPDAILPWPEAGDSLKLSRRILAEQASGLFL